MLVKKLIPLLLLLTIVGCLSAPFHYPKHPLDTTKTVAARTVLVLETQYIHCDNPVKNNSFYLQVTGEIDAVELFEEKINPMDSAIGKQLHEQTSEFIFTLMSEPGVPDIGLDTSTWYGTGDFPVLFEDEIYKLGSASRDYSSLADLGYTHVLQVGFNNAYDASANLLAFGFNGLLYDVRNGAGAEEAIEVRADRGAWRFSVNQVPRSVTTTSTYQNPWYGTSYGTNSGTYSTTVFNTTTSRNCLNVMCIHNNGDPCTLEELFGSEDPLYPQVYTRAALSYMTLAVDHMNGRNPGNVTRMVNIDEFLSYPLPWEIE